MIAAIITLALIVMAVVGLVWKLISPHSRHEDAQIGMMCFSISLSLLFGAIWLVASMNEGEEITQYVQIKQYIEQHVSTVEIEDAALTNSKIKQNEWLYSIQYRAEHYPLCVFDRKTILALEPIE